MKAFDKAVTNANTRAKQQFDASADALAKELTTATKG